MAQPFDLLCFGEDWYKPSFSSSRQIALRMRRGRKLLWVNPLAVRMPSLAAGNERRAFWRKALHKLKTHLKWLRHPEDGIWVLSPLYVPVFLSAKGDRFNARLVAIQVKLMMRVLGFGRPLLLGTATYQPLLAARRIPHQRFFYYYADKMRAFTDLPPAKAEQARCLYENYDRGICAEAERVYCASRAIYEDLVALVGEQDKIVYLPHGVDFKHWQAARTGRLAVPEILRDLAHPVVGYFGSLTDHNNKEILRRILERHPDWSVVLMGKVVGDYTSLARFPNFMLTGAIAYSDLPAWAQVFDIGIMNWIETEWISSSFPVKAQEYLAMGIPVVSVRIHEIERLYGDLIRIAANEEEFVAMVEEELLNDTEAKRQTRVDRVATNDWQNLADRLLVDADQDPAAS